ncbi:unnamed protein product [Calypogeia fissa]
MGSNGTSSFQEIETKNDGARFAFNVQWKDPMSGVVWKYQLMFYTFDNSIEMYDIKNARMFLRRIAFPELTVEQLYLGSVITVYTRRLLIEEYADEFTRRNLQQLQERTVAVIKPDGVQHVGKIIEAICCNGLLIKQLRMCQLSLGQARDFYKVHADKPFFDDLTRHMASGPCVAMELVAEDAICKWKLLTGPACVEVAKMKAPSSLRAQFGTDITRNTVHAAMSYEAARQEGMHFFADRSYAPCARLANCTLGIIKPHAISAGAAGCVISLIQEKFDITSMEMMVFSRANAEEFYDIYKGVVQDFYAMTHELSAGDIIALEISNKESSQPNPVKCFRDLCGPIDPVIARQLRPESIRAQFGVSKVKNAIHCTDLPDDGVLECKFIFGHQWNHD